MRGFKITTFKMITVSLDVRFVNVFFFLLRYECLGQTLALLGIL